LRVNVSAGSESDRGQGRSPAVQTYCAPGTWDGGSARNNDTTGMRCVYFNCAILTVCDK